MQTATYTKEKLVATRYITKELAQHFGMPADVTLHDDVQWMADDLVLRVVQRVYSRELEVLTAHYPADWWQAFKDRWFPEWAKKRWPIQQKVIELKARELLPKMASPDGVLNMEIRTWTEWDQSMVRACDAD